MNHKKYRCLICGDEHCMDGCMPIGECREKARIKARVVRIVLHYRLAEPVEER